MVTKQEAERISAAVNILRPDWRTGLIMTVLGDDKCRNRPYADLLIAMVTVAADPESQKPGRIHEPGPWWKAALASGGTAGPTYPVLGPDDCDICSRPKHPTTDHEYEPRNSRGAGERMTPEQRAAIDKAKEDAHMKATAAKEAAEERKRRSVEEVLVAHKGDDAEVGA